MQLGGFEENKKGKLKFLLFILVANLALSCATNDNYFDLNFDNFGDSTTLTLNSYLHDTTDCGEFGGHQEYILIHKSGSDLVISFARKTSECRARFYKPLPSTTKLSFEGSLGKEKQEFVKEYIRELFEHKPSMNSISNAPTAMKLT